MGEIILKGYQCERCAHKWIPKQGGFDYTKVSQNVNHLIGISLEDWKEETWF